MSCIILQKGSPRLSPLASLIRCPDLGARLKIQKQKHGFGRRTGPYRPPSSNKPDVTGYQRVSPSQRSGTLSFCCCCAPESDKKNPAVLVTLNYRPATLVTVPIGTTSYPRNAPWETRWTRGEALRCSVSERPGGAAPLPTKPHIPLCENTPWG